MAALRAEVAVSCHTKQRNNLLFTHNTFHSISHGHCPAWHGFAVVTINQTKHNTHIAVLRAEVGVSWSSVMLLLLLMPPFRLTDCSSADDAAGCACLPVFMAFRFGFGGSCILSMAGAAVAIVCSWL